ncbi:dipeptide epimerase [candidate division KSB3 bacterium]|uniref:Dipeptide epimerase n=1 Tax=candidate division KSB3 bacterium TaxID=2044937 RepID=A0A2G6KNB9_9BACT|nr:MAG: dipeptide epimerase [candidate division KSB3 bacterium]
MKTATHIITLKSRYPFRIARRKEALTEKSSVMIRLEHEGVVGLGEAQPSLYYYGETIESVQQVVEQAIPLLGDNPFLLEDILHELNATFPEAPAAIAGLDIALHDLVGKLLNVPLYKLFGLNPQKTPQTSYTLGIDTIPATLERLEAARQYPILKVKVGLPGDVEMVKAIRERSDAIIRVDANCGWGVDEAIERINALEAYNIELVEQPIAAKNYEGLRKIRDNVNVPIMADEDAITSEDLPALVGCVDAINIKLMKCRGLREARRMIDTAHIFGMKVMLGCMSESSLAITAAAHLSPLLDYADLDANLLISNDPFNGVKVRDGKLMLPDRSGVGVLPV